MENKKRLIDSGDLVLIVFFICLFSSMLIGAYIDTAKYKAKLELEKAKYEYKRDSLKLVKYGK